MTQCGEGASVTREQADAIENYATARLGGDDAVLAAAIDSGETVVAFVRRGGQWQAYHLAENGGVEALYRSEAGDVFVWAYQGRGDPPFAFSALHVPAGGPAGQFCTAFDVPPSLNEGGWRGEAFGFEQFNLSAQGDGAIIGSSEVERDGNVHSWIFRYRTSDHGRRWSSPERLERPETVPGIFARVEEQDEALLEALRNSLG